MSHFVPFNCRLWPVFRFIDLQASEILHLAFGAAMDCSNSFYCSHLWFGFMVQFVIFPRQLLCLLWQCSGLVRRYASHWQHLKRSLIVCCHSFCHLQLFESLLRVSRRRRQHNVGNTRQTNPIKLLVWHLLSHRTNLFHWLFTILQTSHIAILRRQANHVIPHLGVASIWQIPRRWLEPRFWLSIYHYDLQHQCVACFIWTCSVLLCHSRFIVPLWSCLEVFHC